MVYVKKIRPAVCTRPQTAVFLNTQGRKFSGSGLLQTVQRYWLEGTSAAVPKFSFHGMRHGVVSLVHSKHPSLKAELAEQMSHSSATASKFYRDIQKVATSQEAFIKLFEAVQTDPNFFNSEDGNQDEDLDLEENDGLQGEDERFQKEDEHLQEEEDERRQLEEDKRLQEEGDERFQEDDRPQEKTGTGFCSPDPQESCTGRKQIFSQLAEMNNADVGVCSQASTSFRCSGFYPNTPNAKAPNPKTPNPKTPNLNTSNLNTSNLNTPPDRSSRKRYSSSYWSSS